MTVTYTTVDKDGWGHGPWQDEPDKVSWTDEATGMPCLIKRNPGGALCGYVGVNPDHPWHGVGYGETLPDKTSCRWDFDHGDHEPQCLIDVHGGLTYADGCAHGDEATSICHIPDPGQPDNVWWFGFDCAHSGDLSPKHEMRYPTRIPGDTYKDVAYVRHEVQSLAQQLQAVAA